LSIAPTTDIPVLAAATARLLATVDGMREEQLTEPSLLPGWTRGHVLAHVARNADGLVNLLTGARTGVPTPMYPSPDAREHDIESGSKRSLAEHAADLRASAARFDAAVAAMPEAAWPVEVPHRLGAFPASAVLARRIEEVEYHHVDLGLREAYAPKDWPVAFVRAELGRLAARWAGDADAPSMVLQATDGAGVHSTGRPKPERSRNAELHITGPGGEILAWLAGRADGRGLDVIAGCSAVSDPMSVLPALPPLG
jgi:maleylpyruvate isomerase